MFRLNRNKQTTNRNSLIGSIFCYFFQKIYGFSGFLIFFVCFGCFAESFDVSIEPKQTEGPHKQFEREHIWVFLRKFWLVLVCYETVLFLLVVSILVWNIEKKQKNFVCFEDSLSCPKYLPHKGIYSKENFDGMKVYVHKCFVLHFFRCSFSFYLETKTFVTTICGVFL